MSTPSVALVLCLVLLRLPLPPVSCPLAGLGLRSLGLGPRAGAASKFLTNGLNICWTRSWVFASSRICLEPCVGEVVSVGKIGEGEDGGAEVCEEVEVGNI